MSFVFYQARVRRSFHRMPTLIVPLAFTLVTMAYSVARMFYEGTMLFPATVSHADSLFIIPLSVGLAAIGMDSSEGLLPVLLTRPMKRSSFVLAHWAALGTVGSFWMLLHLMGEWSLVVATAYPIPYVSEVLYNAIDRVSLSFGMAAVMVCFSARLPSFGNLVLWCVLFFITIRVLPGFINNDTRELVTPFRAGLEALLMPMLDFRRTFAATPVSWFRLTTYLSNVSLMLLLAIYIFNRREVSYASR